MPARSNGLVALALLGLPSAIPAAPAPKGKAPVYYPTAVGDTRVYEFRTGDKADGGYTDRVTKVERAGDALHVTVSRERAGADPFVTTLAVSAAGLYRVSTDGRALDPPLAVLKLPAKPGDQWEAGGVTYTVAEEETAEVPAGKFRAIRLEQSSGGSTATLWFAPGVGLVKLARPGSDRVQVLKEFRPGK